MRQCLGSELCNYKLIIRDKSTSRIIADSCGLTREECSKNADLICQAPQLAAENERLREALAFYGNYDNYALMICPLPETYRPSKVQCDNGDIANQALDANKPSDKGGCDED